VANEQPMREYVQDFGRSERVDGSEIRRGRVPSDGCTGTETKELTLYLSRITCLDTSRYDPIRNQVNTAFVGWRGGKPLLSGVRGRHSSFSSRLGGETGETCRTLLKIYGKSSPHRVVTVRGATIG